MDYLVACPNCYRSQPWSGDLVDTACRVCGRHIPVGAMARALVHLFSSAARDPTHDSIADEDGDELLRWLVGRLWGDAMRVGRHDWVYAGCPITTDDVCVGVRQFDGAAFDALGRLLSAGTPPEFLVRATGSIAAAAIGRLEKILPSGVVRHPELDSPVALRGRLYDLLARYPSAEAVTVLERARELYPAMDGDPERPVGAALADALEKCQGIGTKA